MKRTFTFLFLLTALSSCKKHLDIISDIFHENGGKKENPSDFIPIGSIQIGGTGAAEISAFDPLTARLFVVNNSTENKIDVLDLRNPAAPSVIGSISMLPYGGAVNSVAVSDGKLAAAIEAADKQAPGKVVIFNTANYSEVKVVSVGALPDMITYSPDGKFILTANEGEPNSTYTVDPEGSVSIISVKNNYSVATLNFSAFAPKAADLMKKGLRVFGPGASFAQDMEPEYVTVADDSRTAWVTLQENNAIAKIDIPSKTITDIFPLGFKNYAAASNAIDASDRPLGTIDFKNWPAYGTYMPDAIGVVMHQHKPYLFTANEGDAREYSAFAEEARVSSLKLNPAVYNDAATLQQAANLGRLNVTKTLGDANKDGVYDSLFSFGARSFSVWNGLNGSLLFDSGNELEWKTVAAGFYDDDRSDSKGVEPEGLTIGEVNKKKIAFVGMERADAVAVYDVSDPLRPKFLQVFKTGDAPEGVLFIPKKDSPIKRSLLVISSENDGVVSVYTPSES